MTPTPLRNSGDDGRFCYWRGASGRRYIHSIYAIDACPPLPGAIYIAVRRVGGLRTALQVGRFSVFWDLAAEDPVASALASLGANEIDVHLLAEGEAGARAVLSDLQAALTAAKEPASPGNTVSKSLNLAA
jgi:hypothetical protein